MKLTTVGVLGALVLLLLAATVGYAQGHTADQLEEAGWTCFPIPIGGVVWIHCFPPATDLSGDPPATIQVKVFDEPGHPFLGTELLIRADLYNDQPCPQDGKDTYDDLSEEGLPYFACHHFDTSH